MDTSEFGEHLPRQPPPGSATVWDWETLDAVNGSLKMAAWEEVIAAADVTMSLLESKRGRDRIWAERHQRLAELPATAYDLAVVRLAEGSELPSMT